MHPSRPPSPSEPDPARARPPALPRRGGGLIRSGGPWTASRRKPRRPSCAAPAASSAPSLSSVAADPRRGWLTLFFFNGRLAIRRGSAQSAPRDSARPATRPTPVERIRAARTSRRRRPVCAVVGPRRPCGLPARRARQQRLLARGLVARTGSCLSFSRFTGSDRLLGAVVGIQGSGLAGARRTRRFPSSFGERWECPPNGLRWALDPQSHPVGEQLRGRALQAARAGRDGVSWEPA